MENEVFDRKVVPAIIYEYEGIPIVMNKLILALAQYQKVTDKKKDKLPNEV